MAYDLSRGTVYAAQTKTPRELRIRFADSVNVKDFGAKGNGVTDDAAAIQAALDAATGEVIFPPGTYKVNTGLNMRTGLTVRGAGKETVIGGRGTRLSFTGAPDTAVPIRIDNCSDLRIIGFDIRGKATSSAPVIYATGMNRRLRLEDLAVVSSAPVTLVNINPTGEGAAIQSVIDSVVAVGGDTGFAVGAASTSISFNACYANANSGAGYHIRGTYISIVGCASDSNQIGYLFRGAKNVSVVGSGAESNTRSGVVVSLASGISIVSFRSYQNSIGDAGFYPSFLDLQDNADSVTAIGVIDDGASLATYSVGATDGLALDAKLSLINCDLTRQLYSGLTLATAIGNGIVIPAALSTKRVLATYGTSVAINASLGNEFVVSATDGVAFTVQTPTNGKTGQRITVRIRNASGVPLGAITWGAGYKLAAWTSPANGYSRSIDFQFDSVVWVEVSRTPADVPT